MARDDLRYQISLPKDTGEEMEAFAMYKGISKSTLINLAIREYISNDDRWTARWDDPNFQPIAE